MLVFVELFVINGYIKEISLIRMTKQRKIMAQYSARICPENPLADAIKPIAVIIKKNDDIIFNSQMERDCFVSAAKRWVDVKILKRAKVSPHKSTCGTKTSQAPYNGNE